MIKVEKTSYRSLVDSGAEVSLIHRRVIDRLRNKPKIHRKRVHLQAVNGEPLAVDGVVDIEFSIGVLTFVVVTDMNRNIILGRDWLSQNGVRLYFDLNCLRIKKSYVRLEADIHISSIVRLASKTVIKPQTINICRVKVKQGPHYQPTQLFQISAQLEEHDTARHCINI